MRFIQLASLLLLFILVSCVSVQSLQNDTKEPINAELWIRYLPETDNEAQFRLGVRPVPMDNGWTDLRIERDLERMSYCGINVVMLEATPGQLTNEEFLGRFRHFCGKSSEKRLRVVLSLVQSKGSDSKIERSNLVQYLESLGLASYSSYLTENERPIILIDESFALSDAQYNENVVLLRFGKEMPPYPDVTVQQALALDSEYVWCLSGFCNAQGEWLVRRRQGTTLQAQFNTVRKSRCRVVLVSSWNDYSRGDFIEKNSLDGDTVMRALKER